MIFIYGACMIGVTVWLVHKWADWNDEQNVRYGVKDCECTNTDDVEIWGAYSGKLGPNEW